MYRPPAFRVDNSDELFDMIEQLAFGNLVTSGPTGLEATGLPLLVERSAGDLGMCRGHFARANGHWWEIDGAEALVIFQGVDGYVSPSWYPSKLEHGKVVPTWNYEVVHVHGTNRVHDDTEWVRELVTDLTNRHEPAASESTGREPWKISDAPNEFVDRQLKAIVGVEIEITRLEGKRKLSQNRSDADRLGAIDGLTESKRNRDRSLAAAMRPAKDGPGS